MMEFTPPPYRIDPPGTRKEWEDERNYLMTREDGSQRHGGSSIASKINLQSSVYQQYKKAVGLATSYEALTIQMINGIKYEPVARTIWRAMYPRRIVLETYSMKFGDDYVASPDGFIMWNETDWRVFEIKSLQTESWARVRDWRKFPYNIDPQYYPQLELYCRASNLKQAVLCVTLRNQDQSTKDLFDLPANELHEIICQNKSIGHQLLRFFTYTRSDRLWAYIQERIAAFDACVRARKAPLQAEWRSVQRTRAHVVELVLQDINEQQ